MFLPDALLEKLSDMLIDNKHLTEELPSGGINPIPKYTENDMSTIALVAQADTLQHLLSWAMKHNIAMQCDDVLRGLPVESLKEEAGGEPPASLDNSSEDDVGVSNESQTEEEKK